MLGGRGGEASPRVSPGGEVWSRVRGPGGVHPRQPCHIRQGGHQVLLEGSCSEWPSQGTWWSSPSAAMSHSARWPPGITRGEL